MNQNPVLKKAGVVDAGGRGFLVILQGMLDELRGKPMPETAGEEAQEAADKADFVAMSAEEITFAFDTVFIVRKNRENVDLEPFRPTSTASATAWSSARTTRPSRSTSTPTPPAPP